MRSSVRGVLTCSPAWYFRRTGVPPETRALALVDGVVLHEVIAEDLRHRMKGASLDERDALELLKVTYFVEEASGVKRVRQASLGGDSPPFCKCESRSADQYPPPSALE